MRVEYLRHALHLDLSDALDAWCEALQGAYSTTLAFHKRRLKDESNRMLDSAGLHPASVEWGRVFAIEALVPGLSDVRYDPDDVKYPLCTPRAMHDFARQQALEEFLTDHTEGSSTA